MRETLEGSLATGPMQAWSLCARQSASNFVGYTMAHQLQATAMIHRRTRVRIAALAFALCAVSAAKLASAGALTVSEAETQGLEFFDVLTCVSDGGDGVSC